MSCLRALAVVVAVVVAICGATAAGAEPGDDGLESCIAALRDELASHPEVEPKTFDAYTRRAADLRPLIDDATRGQPEFRLAIWDYLARLADAERVAQGRTVLAREAPALDAIAQRTGVDAATTVAVFGVESDYGRVAGRYPVVDATLSRACLDLSSAERKRHLFAALWLLQEGIVAADDFKGSWAGAFGMTQFMPGTFVGVMRDAPEAAPADIVHRVADALATTGRYLKSLGWIAGLAWGVEVRASERLAIWNAAEADHACFASVPIDRRCRSVETWFADGVVAVDGAALGDDARPGEDARPGRPALPSSTPAALLMPAGAAGPAWLVTSNYQAIWRYNRSDAYALAIGLLSNALKDLPPLRTAWPTDDPGLSRREFREVQTLLLRAGHRDVTVDGADGPRTRAAVEDEERRLGWTATGRAGRKLLEALRTAVPREDGSVGER